MIKKKQNKKKRPAHDLVDDGRTVAPMDIDGMPWVSGNRPGRQATGEAAGWQAPEALKQHTHTTLSRQETRRLITSSLLVALGIGLIYVAAFGLFLWFAISVWLR